MEKINSFLKYKNLIIIIIFVHFVNYLFGQTSPTSTTIERVILQPMDFEGDLVEVEGTIINYVSGAGATDYYLLRGDFAGIIRVNTSAGAPLVNYRYKVRGIVYLKDGKPFISEQIKNCLDCPPLIFGINPNQVNKGETAKLYWEAPLAKKVTINGVNVENSGERLLKADENEIFTIVVEYKDGGKIIKQAELTVRKGGITLSPYIYVLAAVFFLLIIGSIVFVVAQRQGRLKVPEIKTDEIRTVQSTVSPSEKPTFTSLDDFKTIKIVKEQTVIPPTVKILPGKLIFVDGPDKGKEFKLVGRPTQEGEVVTIGRKDVPAELAYSHVKLLNPTVAREQAEIIYSNNRFYLRNLAKTNHSIVNGVELNVNQIVELVPNSIIEFGELKFRFSTS